MMARTTTGSFPWKVSRTLWSDAGSSREFIRRRPLKELCELHVFILIEGVVQPMTGFGSRSNPLFSQI